ncbi:MAG: hypothetical protein MUC93_07570 [Bacteroidales bacterium]|jgi:ABC-type maltose transport system permease subunit|nr:hypothetical protein [Bacteroidales bacterium]
MKPSEIKKLLIDSLSTDNDPAEAARQLQDAGLSYDFSREFSARVTDKLFSASSAVIRHVEFVRSMNYAFSRIALTGAAAIVLLLISIFIMEGSFSLNSILGLSDSIDESIICLLTGN